MCNRQSLKVERKIIFKGTVNWSRCETGKRKNAANVLRISRYSGEHFLCYQTQHQQIIKTEDLKSLIDCVKCQESEMFKRRLMP